MIDLTEYHNLKAEGRSTSDCLAHAKAQNLNLFEKIFILREVFELSLIDAKEIVICDATKYDSIESYQEKLLHGLEQALKELKDDYTE